MIRKEQKHVPFPNTGENLGQHRTIWQEAPAWIFGSIQSLENEGILYVFLVFQTEEVGQKDGCGSQTQLRGVAIKMKIQKLFSINVTGFYIMDNNGINNSDFIEK